MTKLPSFQFYPGDWRRDTQVQMADMETRGVWFEMLCCMWDAPDRGTITGTCDEIARLIGCDIVVLERTIDKLDRLKIADVTRCHDKVTVINRRMSRDQKIRTNACLRKRRQREKTRDANPCISDHHIPERDVTPASSFSSSKKKDISVEISQKEEEDKKPHGDFVRLTDREYGILTGQYGSVYVERLIERMNNHIGSKGMKYVSHFYTLKQWALNDEHDRKAPVKTSPHPDDDQLRKIKEEYRKKAQEYRERLLTVKPAANNDFKKKVIEPLKEECNEHSWRMFIEPLAVVCDTGESCVIFSEQAVWVQENYRTRIEEKLGRKVVLTDKIIGETEQRENGKQQA